MSDAQLGQFLKKALVEVPLYFFQVIVASAGAVGASFLFGAWLVRLIDSEREIYMRPLGEPYFVLPILAGFVLGYLINLRLKRRSGLWVWPLPLLLLVLSIGTWNRYAGQNWWLDVWDNFFGRSCGGSGCIYEWMGTAPFYTSVAYSLAALAALRKARDDKPGNSPTQ